MVYHCSNPIGREWFGKLPPGWSLNGWRAELRRLIEESKYRDRRACERWAEWLELLEDQDE